MVLPYDVPLAFSTNILPATDAEFATTAEEAVEIIALPYGKC